MPARYSRRRATGTVGEDAVLTQLGPPKVSRFYVVLLFVAKHRFRCKNKLHNAEPQASSRCCLLALCHVLVASNSLKPFRMAAITWRTSPLSEYMTVFIDDR